MAISVIENFQSKKMSGIRHAQTVILNPAVAYQAIVKSQHGSKQFTRKICALIFQIIPHQYVAQHVKGVNITHSVGQVVVQVMEDLNFVENLAMMNLAKPSMTAHN